MVSGKITEFAFIETHLSPRFRLDTRHRYALRSRRDRRRAKFRDHSKNLREQIFRNRYLGHLERDVARMADNLRADFDQLLPQRRHRPVADRLRRRQSAHEVAKVVGERVKLEADGIGGEGPTGKSRPFDRALALDRSSNFDEISVY